MMMLEKAFGAQCNEHLKTEAHMGRRYSSLMGKEGVYVTFGMKEIKCVVSGMDWRVGLTLQQPDTKAYVMCALGPKSPQLTKDSRKSWRFNARLYQKVMQYVYDQIKSGKPVLDSEITKLAHKFDYAMGTQASARTCAFSQ